MGCNVNKIFKVVVSVLLGVKDETMKSIPSSWFIQDKHHSTEFCMNHRSYVVNGLIRSKSTLT